MKRKSVFILSVFCLIIGSLKAQQKIIDSLERQIINPTNELTVIENLNELSWYYAHSNPNKGIEKANKAIKYAIDKRDSLQLGIAYERKGFNYQNKGKDSLTVLMYNLAEEVYQRANHKNRLASLTFNKANFYLFRSKYRKSLDNAQKALDIFKSNSDSLKMGRAFNQIALNYLYLGNYTEALNAFQKGALLFEQIDKEQTSYYAEIQGNLGLLYEKLSDYKTALEFQNKALTIHLKNNYQRGVANTYNNLGKLHGLLNEHEKALEVFNLSYKIKKQNGNKYRIANAITNLGITYKTLKQHDKAFEYFNQAKSIYKELGHNTNLSTVFKNLGDIYLDEKHLKKAEIQFDSAYIYAVKAEDKRALYLAKEGLGKSAFQNKNYKKAFAEQQEATMIKDSLLSNEKRDEYANIKARYQYEKEKAVLKANFEKDKALDETKIQRQTLMRNVSIGVGIVGVSILTIILTLFRRKKEAELNAKLTTSELQKLRAQLNPHFIFNSLNSINDYVMKNEKEAASNYLVRFSLMMRKILNNSNEQEISLSDELEFLETYIKLEQQRLEHKFEYVIEVDKAIDMEDTLVPPALFQPFIENSIWHGLSEKKGKGHLTVSFNKDKNTLVCIIDDNGIGIKTKPNTKKKSFGTSNTQSRIELLNKLKRGDAQINFNEKEEGIQVVVRLPLSLEE